MGRELPVFNKPKEGDACNNCGFCCYAQACDISVFVFGDGQVPCTALEMVGDKFYCGILRSPLKYLPNMQDPELRKVFTETVELMLGVGKGCCTEDNELVRYYLRGAS